MDVLLSTKGKVIPATRFIFLHSRAFEESSLAAQPLQLPLAVEAGEAGLSGEELLHGGLFEVALLGDEPVQRTHPHRVQGPPASSVHKGQP
jgi:hypothetical protein